MKKIISILSTLSLTTTLTLPLISCKQNKPLTYLERDRTLITCNKKEKIGMINIRYWTNDEPNIKKNTILLWCTTQPKRWELGNDVSYASLNLFYGKFKDKMNLKTYGVDSWNNGPSTRYSKEWDGLYPDNYFIK